MQGVLKSPSAGSREREAVQQLWRRGRAVFLIEREVSCWGPIWVVGVLLVSIVGHCRLRAIDMSLDFFRYSNFSPLPKRVEKTTFPLSKKLGC